MAFFGLFGGGRRSSRRKRPRATRRPAARRAPSARETAARRAVAQRAREIAALERLRAREAAAAERAERKAARAAASLARRAVRERERETLLGQRLRLAGLRRQERARELQARRDAREGQRVRRQAAAAMHAYRSVGSTPAQSRRSYAEIFGPETNPAAAAIAVAMVADRMLGPVASGGRNPSRVDQRRRLLANPSRRSSATAERQARALCGRVARGERVRNPGLPSLVAELGKGGLMAVVQEEFKEWRNKLHQQAQKGRRRNPTHVPDHADPTLRDISRRFHGLETEILHLSESDRRAAMPPQHVVRIGHERATVYKPAPGSHRADAEWEHEAGDLGGGRRINGARVLVADARGNVYTLRGSSRMIFDPDRGLVG